MHLIVRAMKAYCSLNKPYSHAIAYISILYIATFAKNKMLIYEQVHLKNILAI